LDTRRKRLTQWNPEVTLQMSSLTKELLWMGSTWPMYLLFRGKNRLNHWIQLLLIYQMLCFKFKLGLNHLMETSLLEYLLIVVLPVCTFVWTWQGKPSDSDERAIVKKEAWGQKKRRRVKLSRRQRQGFARITILVVSREIINYYFDKTNHNRVQHPMCEDFKKFRGLEAQRFQFKIHCRLFVVDAINDNIHSSQHFYWEFSRGLEVARRRFLLGMKYIDSKCNNWKTLQKIV